MFEFFGALIIGGFFLVKFVFGRIASGTSPSIEKRAKELEKKIRNLEFQWSLESKLSSIDTRWELLNSIQDELCEIYGAEWKKLYDCDIYESSYDFWQPWTKAFNILLAKNGMISSRSYWLNAPFWMDGYEEEPLKMIKTLRFMENHMHDNGVDIHILYIPHKSRDGEISTNFFKGMAVWDYDMKIGPLIGIRCPGIKRLWQ